jgi:hypothetical protein
MLLFKVLKKNVMVANVMKAVMCRAAGERDPADVPPGHRPRPPVLLTRLRSGIFSPASLRISITSGFYQQMVIIEIRAVFKEQSNTPDIHGVVEHFWNLVGNTVLEAVREFHDTVHLEEYMSKFIIHKALFPAQNVGRYLILCFGQESMEKMVQNQKRRRLYFKGKSARRRRLRMGTEEGYFI